MLLLLQQCGVTLQLFLILEVWFEQLRGFLVELIKLAEHLLDSAFALRPHLHPPPVLPDDPQAQLLPLTIRVGLEVCHHNLLSPLSLSV